MFKAFDRVKDTLLKEKLVSVGCGGTLPRWLADYLPDRTQQVPCVVVKTPQFGLNFELAFVLQIMRLCPLYHFSSCRTSVSFIPLESSWKQANSQSRFQVSRPETNGSVVKYGIQQQLVSRTECMGCVLRVYQHTVVCGQ